ncbi:negative transcriptional regulator, PaiB family [Oryzisolibacter propanilivorax]|uniref:Negative transcriptional regulator, PaiB family n=1 Tax=Oryzisolibacter propanilivorax TaxID=1527607 RepID=A0A1G9QIN2_9BURK|nr:FMN-binding negative transcriptional regulator [Oryzisolibacter propanilivorax]SDM10826.1 negative transcriptional regulator, PaiB family [Oryzisolibacter propanilivorax]
MYLPAAFNEERPDALHALICEHPLGLLCRQGPQGLDADHMPFLLDAGRGPHGTLVAHVARANALWREVPAGGAVDALVVFRGQHGYISPNWYPSKHETHRAVPTWNYEAVHVHGRLSVHDDERHVRGVVARLTRRHEAGEPRPWKMGDAPRDYLDEMLRAIVGIEVRITRIEGKRKLSQNRTAPDREGAIAALAERGCGALARAMRDAGDNPGPG